MKKVNDRGFGAVELVIIILLVAILGLVAWYTLGRNKSGTEKTTTSTSPPKTTTSEQPDQAKFNEYFSLFNLAKLPAGKHISAPDSLPVDTTTFSTSDQLCENMIVKKLVPSNSLSSAIYSVSTKQNVTPKVSFPNELAPGPGTSSGCGTLGVGTGSYEFKAYIDNVLVVDQPFEVK